MSTISFYFLLKVSRFSNTYYNDNYLRQFTELQINILQDRKKSHTSKFPHNTIQQGDLCTKQSLDINIGVSRIYFNGGGFIKFGR